MGSKPPAWLRTGMADRFAGRAIPQPPLRSGWELPAITSHPSTSDSHAAPWPRGCAHCAPLTSAAGRPRPRPEAGMRLSRGLCREPPAYLMTKRRPRGRPASGFVDTLQPTVLDKRQPPAPDYRGAGGFVCSACLTLSGSALGASRFSQEPPTARRRRRPRRCAPCGRHPPSGAHGSPLVTL